MQIEELLNEGLKREFKVTIPSVDLDAKLDEILNEFRTKANIKGFRPGKAPLSLVKKLHGERAMGQVLQDSIQAKSQELLAEKSLRPATQPQIELDSYEAGSDLAFRMSLEVLPSIDVSGFKAPSLERWVVEVSDKDLDAALERIAAQQKTFKKAAKTVKAKSGDAVLIDFVGRVDGVAFDGGSAEDFQLELGSGTFIPGFEEQLEGVKADEEKLVEVTFPANYGSENLAGKAAEFTVTVKEVRRVAETTIDDEMAKNMGFENLDGLKDALKEQLARDNGQLSRAHLKRRLLDALADSYSFDVPPSMVDAEFSQIWEQIKHDAMMSGEAKAEDFEGKTQPDDEAEAAEFRSIAERRVRLGLLLSEIGVSNDVQITQEEVNRRMFEEARRYPGQEAQVLEFFRNNAGALAQLRAPLFEEKVVDFILEMADLKDKTSTREELENALRAMDEEDDAAVKPKAAKKAPAKKAAAKKDATEEKTPAKKAPAKKPAAKKAAKKDD